MMAAVPEHLACPISAELMVDPVMVAESFQTYERASIERWFRTKKTDPMTNLALRSTTLVPNARLRAASEAWQRRGGSAPATPAPSTVPSASRSGQRWTESDKKTLRESPPSSVVADLAKRLGRSEAAIVSAKANCHETPNRGKAWSRPEEARLKALKATGLSTKQLGQALGRSNGAITSRLAMFDAAERKARNLHDASAGVLPPDLGSLVLPTAAQTCKVIREFAREHELKVNLSTGGTARRTKVDIVADIAAAMRSKRLLQQVR